MWLHSSPKERFKESDLVSSYFLWQNSLWRFIQTWDSENLEGHMANVEHPFLVSMIMGGQALNVEKNEKETDNEIGWGDPEDFPWAQQ
jgi:hypothetical protein